MDPQQRFSLEVCLEAIEDAGTSLSELPTRTGVFFGVTAILNVILGAVRQRFALSRADLVLIYVMMLMAVIDMSVIRSKQ